MVEQLQSKILTHLKSGEYRPQTPNTLAKQLKLSERSDFPAFRNALRELMHAGRVVLADGNVMLPTEHQSDSGFVGAYRHNQRGFGFVVPSDPGAHEDLFIPEGE